MLVWTKAPVLFRNELVAVDGLGGATRAAKPGEVKRLGTTPRSCHWRPTAACASRSPLPPRIAGGRSDHWRHLPHLQKSCGNRRPIPRDRTPAPGRWTRTDRRPLAAPRHRPRSRSIRGQWWLGIGRSETDCEWPGTGPTPALVVGASLFHHAQGAGIWPDGAGMPNHHPQALSLSGRLPSLIQPERKGEQASPSKGDPR